MTSSNPPQSVLAVSLMDRQCCYEGELFDLSDLSDRLAEPVGHWQRETRQIPPGIVATDDPGGLLQLLDRRFSRPGEPGRNLWQWQVSLRSQSLWLGNNPSPVHALIPHLTRFGWAAKHHEYRRPGGRSRYYTVLDVFGWTEAAEILEAYPGLLVEQMARFAIDLAGFCQEQQLPTKLTAAGIAGMLLKRSPFRKITRKVPQATNKRARGQLPGNFYRLTLPQPASEEEQPVRLRGEILELDLTSAHHWAAMHLHPPAAEDIYAWGRFYDDRSNIDADSLVSLEDIRGEHGLLLAAVESYARLDPLSHPATNHNGTKWRYVWTPEIPLLLDTPGVDILGVKAGWTGNRVDWSLCEYAWQATQQLAQATPARRRWLKHTLLAAYGLLAARPRPHMILHRWGRGQPTPVRFPSGHEAYGYLRETKTREPATTNVIWRGMIESWVRAEAIAQARQLRNDGWRVISIYADAVYVQARGDMLPQLRPNWRINQRLHNMTFLAPTHFVSDEIDKLPGIPRSTRRAA